MFIRPANMLLIINFYYVFVFFEITVLNNTRISFLCNLQQNKSRKQRTNSEIQKAFKSDKNLGDNITMTICGLQMFWGIISIICVHFDSSPISTIFVSHYLVARCKTIISQRDTWLFKTNQPHKIILKANVNGTNFIQLLHFDVIDIVCYSYSTCTYKISYYFYRFPSLYKLTEQTCLPSPNVQLEPLLGVANCFLLLPKFRHRLILCYYCSVCCAAYIQRSEWFAYCKNLKIIWFIFKLKTYILLHT